MKICGSCFRHASFKSRATFLRAIRDGFDLPDAKMWCQACGSRAILDTSDWTPEAIAISIATTEAHLG